ncbi:MAG: penicillin acylase family protein [Nocardioidaceae bacterium]
MRRPWSYVVFAAAVLAIALVAAGIFGVITVRASFPKTSGEITVPGLANKVEIYRDRYGVPQIYADNADDLFFAQGYVQAQDRFFQMDFERHVTSGRLAELVGRSALSTDEFVRTLGWRRVAQKEVALLSPTTGSYLQSYSDGVNAYINGKSGGQLSLEYSVLSVTGPDYAPQPWTPVDSVSWLKAMAWDLRSNMDDEINRVLATDTLSPEQVNQLYPPYPYATNPPIVQGGAVVHGRFVQPGSTPLQRSPVRLDAATRARLSSVRSIADRMPALLGTRTGIGSNSWVVSGARSTTGKPLLANDPHLAPSMPGIWYEMGLHCTTITASCPFDVSGFTFAGMPGVVIGHNQSIAWGLTTMYADVTDLYLEKVDEATGTYQYGNRQLPLRTRTESFRVEGEANPVTIKVRSTRHGPIISDLDAKAADLGSSASRLANGAGSDAGAYAVSLQWTALKPGRTMDSVLAIDKAQNWNQFRAAARLFAVPSQNLVYADVYGHIGYQAPGLIPIRKTGNGLWPAPGWDPRYGWKAYVPFNQLPTELDPPSGYIVTANQAVIGPQYPYRISSDSAYGYRSKRIQNLLLSRPKLSVDDMAAMQLDTRNPMAPTLVPYLLRLELPTFYYRQGQSLLKTWDFTQPADSAAAAYYNMVWSEILTLTFHDKLPSDVWPDGGERWYAVVSRLLKEPNSTWWDDPRTAHVETRDDVLTTAMEKARDDLTRLQARDPHTWTWGHLHQLRLVNQTLGTSGIGPVEALFNRGPYGVGGGGGLVDATSWDAADGFGVTSVPSMRMVVSMANLDDSRWIELGGESGHAFASHYNDQTPLWLDGRTMPWAFTRSAVDGSTDDRLLLDPAPSS